MHMQAVPNPAEIKRCWNEEVRDRRVFQRLEVLLDRAKQVTGAHTWTDASAIVDIALGLKEISLRYCIRVSEVQTQLWAVYKKALAAMPEPSAYDTPYNNRLNLYSAYSPDSGIELDRQMIMRVAQDLKPATCVDVRLARLAEDMGLMVTMNKDKVNVSKRMVVSDVYDLSLILRNFDHIHRSISEGLAGTYIVASEQSVADWLTARKMAGETIATKWIVLDIMQGLLFGYPVSDIRSFIRTRPFQSIRDRDFYSSNIPVPIENLDNVQFRRVLIEVDLPPNALN